MVVPSPYLALAVMVTPTHPPAIKPKEKVDTTNNRRDTGDGIEGDAAAATSSDTLGASPLRPWSDRLVGYPVLEITAPPLLVAVGTTPNASPSLQTVNRAKIVANSLMVAIATYKSLGFW